MRGREEENESRRETRVRMKIKEERKRKKRRMKRDGREGNETRRFRWRVGRVTKIGVKPSETEAGGNMC